MKARAAVLVDQKKPLEIGEIEIPPLRFGQVLVKLFRSGICGSQIGEINGVKGPDKYLPHLLGHEGSGVVVDTGEGVKTVKTGDSVVLHWRPGSGLQGEPPLYKSAKFGTVNAGWITTFNEYAVVSENRVTAVPKGLDVDIAVFLGCAVTTGLGVVNNNAKLKIGQSIVVYGAGGVGLNIIQGAAMVSAYPVVAVDLFDKRLELACKMGATHTINASSCENIEEQILKITGSSGADVVVDNTGNPEVISRCYNLTSSSGRTVLVGVPAKGNCAQIYTLPLHFEKSLAGSHGGESRPDIDIPNYIKLIEAGKLDLSPLIAKYYTLDRINDAIEDMKSGAVAGRCIIKLAEKE